MQEMHGKPFAYWLQQARVVRAGQRADYYAVTRNREHGVALFREDQTEALVPPDISDMVDVIPAEEWRARRQHAPRIRVRPWGDGLAVWVGNNKPAIEILKKAGWRYSPVENRWVHQDRGLDRFKGAMEEAGFEVIVDG